MRLTTASAIAIMTVLSCAPAAAQAQAISAAEAEAMRAQIRSLKAQVETLEKRLDAASGDSSVTQDASPAHANPVSTPAAAVAAATAAAATPTATTAAAPAAKAETTSVTWKGAPQFKQGDLSFKPKGRIQADANYVGAPSSLNDPGLGFSTEVRRIRLGAEGNLSKEFGYKLELELSDNAVDLVDTFISYTKGPWLVQVGNQNAFQSLDELTGDTTGSVMERAAFTDAFNFERRLGAMVQYHKGPWLVQGGVFSDDIDALSNDAAGDENNSVALDGRLVYAPEIDGTQLHFGASMHWRDLNSMANQGTRYRQRPFVHSTDTRLIGTSNLFVDQESHYGVEFAALRGRWHAAAEYHALTADRVGDSSVSFQGAYGEVGVFLTRGDHRGYRDGIFRAETPANPMGGKDGGFGSVLFTLRYDWLDLNDRDINGGTQNGYIAALVWEPINYLRLNLNVALLDFTGATALPSGRTDYSAKVVGTRVELDF